MLEAIRAAEQEVRTTESRYRDAFETLRPKSPRWADGRPEFAVLGNIDSVPVIEVAKDYGYKNSPDTIAETASYQDQKYHLLAKFALWRTCKPIQRAIKLTEEGIPHVFGLVEEGPYNPTEAGVFVPRRMLVSTARRHAQEVLRDYPTLNIEPEVLGQLNLSTDFIYNIETQVNLGKTSEAPDNHVLMVDPVVDSNSYSYGRDFGFPEKVTDFYIKKLPAGEISLSEFFDGQREGTLEELRETMGATCYRSVAGPYSEDGQYDYLFRFNKILSPAEMADALQKLGQPQEGTYQIILHRLSERLRSLVNLPLDQTIPSPTVKSFVDEDFKFDQRRRTTHYLSLSTF